MDKLPLGLALDLRQVVPYKTGSWRTMKPLYIMQTPPCTHSCPINNDIRGFLRVLADKQDYEEAWHILTRTNPFPGICGRVCPHPCEDGCNRRDFDTPLAINSSERCVGDYGLEKHLEHRKEVLTTRKEKVAVVGSGPAGLSCAFHLAKRGFAVKVFEAAREPGGMMRYGIPAYRLPKDVLDREIEAILKLGVDLECNVKVGVNIPFDQLRHDYHAVFLGLGAQKGASISIPGDDARNVFTGVGFLKEVNSGKAPEVGRNVVVVGGGNTAMDCARVAKRLGADVSIVYRRTRVEMPAITAEIDEAMEERIMFRYHTNPIKIIADEGRVVGLLCVQMELKEADASGRARPVPIPGSESVVQADTVIMATGQEVDYDGIDLAKRENRWRAAAAIEDYIEANVESSLASPPVVYFKDMNSYYYTRKKRFTKEAIPVHERLKSFHEIYAPFDPGEIIGEANRCLSCGLCFNCQNCLMYCPDNAVNLEPETGKYEFDYGFCKGCGLCVKECPCHYIQLTLEK
ncbi:MAG: FAD-dependent oxidoreductase [Deltaproteobacteria bacterium]|nr:FAD-dependent oxidoreductase [Deltaproteobacteria bacterium]